MGMLLDDVSGAVAALIDEQSQLGIQITDLNDVQDTGPTNKGVWNRIEDVTAVFADMKKSTMLNVRTQSKTSARAYAYFVKSMARIADHFGAKYMDIQGDGLFALFSGDDSVFHALGCAVTMRTLTEQIAERLKKDAATDWNLTVGVGMDRKTVLVRRLGLRSVKENEVWAGKPVSMAAHLSHLAGENEVMVSERVYERFQSATRLRRRAIIRSCGCRSGVVGDGLDADEAATTILWAEECAPEDASFDFTQMHRLKSKWCAEHGRVFCETIVTGRRPQ